MKKNSLILFLLLIWITTNASYFYQPLARIINKSDYCVLGTIVNLDVNYFYLKKEEVIYGTPETDTIKIMRFINWNCGKRYDEYRIGQKEIVYYSRSNNVIDDYDLIGFGAGGEFETAITNDSTAHFQTGYNEFKDYNLLLFKNAIKEYKKLSEECFSTAKIISDSVLQEFRGRSDLHSSLIRQDNLQFKRAANRYESVRSSFQSLPQKEKTGIISNAETDFLYKGYDNKLIVQIENENFEDLTLDASGCEVTKKDRYFIVNPTEFAVTIWVYVKKISSSDSITLLSKLFNVCPVPEPTVYFDHEKGDTISLRQSFYGVPSVKYGLGEYFTNQYLEYTVLKFDANISSGNSVKTIKCKNGTGNHELTEALMNLRVGDKLTYSNLTVLFPDQSIRIMPEKVIYISE